MTRDAYQNEKAIENRWIHNLGGRAWHIIGTHSRESRTNIGVEVAPELNSWNQRADNHLNIGNRIHGGAIRFFVNRHNRPRLVYVKPFSYITEILFRNEQGGEIKRRVNVLQIMVGNSGNTDALLPRVGVALHLGQKKEKEWLDAFFLELEPTITPLLREVPVRLPTDMDKITDLQLAHAFITEGMKRADTLISKAASQFVVAFAFEGKDKFYFASDNLLELPTGHIIHITLSGHASNMPPSVLSYDYSFLLMPLRWDDMSLVKSEEELSTVEEL